MRERLCDVEFSSLPTVDQVREQLRARQAEPEPEPAPEIDREAEERARLDAMAQELASREYDDDTPGYDPERDDGDLSQQRDEHYEAIARAEEAALDAEIAAARKWWTDYQAEQQAAHDELDAINDAVRDQFRQQREALNEAERQAADLDYLAKQTRERGDDSALNAARAMEDLARTDPHGTARNFGHPAGDRLKSPEEMRREWADLMRGGRTADQMAAEWKQAEKDAAAERAPDASFNDQTPDARFTDPAKDPAAERASWAERLRGFTAKSAPEARRDAEADRTHQPAPEPAPPAQAPEAERVGLFQRLRDYVRGWFETAPRTEHASRERQMADDKWGTEPEKEDQRFKLKPDPALAAKLAEEMAKPPEPAPPRNLPASHQRNAPTGNVPNASTRPI